MDLATALPKIDLHCHLAGTARADTVRELAAGNGVCLPADPAEFYPEIWSHPPRNIDYSGTAVPLPEPAKTGTPGYSLLGVTEWIVDVVRTEADFARLAYEAIADARSGSNVWHLELYFEASLFLRRGIPYRTVVNGLIEGIRAGRQEFGTTALLIAGIDRSGSGAAARELVEQVLAHPRAEVVGIGLDNLETAGPPRKFAEAYELAGRHGLRRTAHAGEHDPTARNVTDCLDVLGCDRIDHGYFLLEEPEAVERCRAARTQFTCIFTTSRRSWRPWRRASITAMHQAGLRISIASDDPALFPTTLADEYAIAREALGELALPQLCRNAVDACWLNQDAKADLRARVEAELRGHPGGMP